MEQHIFGVVIGAGSVLAGWVLSKLADVHTEEVSYLHHVPQFRDFQKLKEHLKNSPSQKADVLVEGTSEKLANAALYSDKAGMEGAARLVTTTTYSKLYNEEHQTWRDMSNTIENVNVSLPFNLVDSRGNSVRVESVHVAGGFRQILQRVYQEKTLPEQRSMGDYATSVALREIPNGSLTREFLLVFGTSLAGYGNAVLQKSSIWSGGEIVFSPMEVGTTIHGLIARNEMIAKTYKFFSLMFLIGGGSVLFFSIAPFVIKLFRTNEPERRRAVATEGDHN